MNQENESTGLPVLPTKNTVLFPKLMMPLVVGRESSVAAVEEALSTEDKHLLLIPQKKAEIENPAFEDLYQVGTLGVVKKLERQQDRLQIIVQGTDRIKITEGLEERPFLRGRYVIMPLPQDSGAEIEGLQRAVMDLAVKILELINPEAKAVLSQVNLQIKDPLEQVFLIASMLTLDVDKEQALLEAESREDALRKMHDYLSHELQVLQVRQQISSQAQTEMTKQQREYYLRQQLKAIQEELGETSPEKAETEELRKRLDETELPEQVRKEAERELTRLERMPPAAPDYQMTRSYLELVLELPWDKATQDNFDINRARQVLDEDHFDLDEVKARIIEHLAVMKLNPEAKAPILCFVGPPGVGKTSLGQSIARSLERKFERMSLGGLHDESELRGHRRTYIGAMPGRIIQAIRRGGVKNPLLMLDEVDKLGRDFRGDPSSALMEILDPAQNSEFRDNYLNLPFDLSKVFFITTANTLDTIPRPLLDRMEVLRISGYSDEEKANIARRYLLPRQIKESGLKKEQIVIPDDTLMRVIHRYTRESGVRELERTLGRLCRKVATRFAEGKTEPVTIQTGELHDYLGKEKFLQEETRRVLTAGVVAGLAYTPVGGEVLYIETVLLPEGKDFTLTGQLGDVMKESARAALSYVTSQGEALGVHPERLKSGVHIHVPAGATPKDGPSAGVAMATALASLFSNLPARSDTAMTGEITLSGMVLPVGGIKEKVLAAHRADLKRVILPRQNEQDLSEIPQHIRDELEFTFVENISEVLKSALPELKGEMAAV